MRILRNLGTALLIVVGSGLAGLSLPAGATALGDAAAQLQPGQWRTLNRAGDGSGFDLDLIVSCWGADCGDNILNYADKGMWNPLTREIQFVGKGHQRLLKHISYTEATNRWVIETKPWWDCSDQGPTCYSIAHGYEHSTINPANGDVYTRLFNSTIVYKWTRSSKTWTQLPAAGPNPNVAVALEYFPEMDGVVLAGNGQLHLYRESTKAWTQLASGLSMGSYHNVASYSKAEKAVVFGGGNGSTQLYRLSATGTVSPVANAPAVVAVRQSVFTVDPVSGRFLLFSSGGGFYEYNAATDRWATLPTAGVQLFVNNPSGDAAAYRVAVPISTHGVIAFLAEAGTSETRVMLYRHAPSAAAPPPDTTPPAPPAGLAVQ